MAAAYYIMTSLSFLLIIPFCITVEYQQYVLASPTRSFVPVCHGDLVAESHGHMSDAVIDPDNVGYLQNMTGLGGSAMHQIHKLLYPLDGRFGTRGKMSIGDSSDGLLGHRIVAIDMRLADLKSLDVINGAFSVSLRDQFSGGANCPCLMIDQHNGFHPHVYNRRHKYSFFSAG